MIAPLLAFLMFQAKPGVQLPVHLLGSPQVRRDLGLTHGQSVKICADLRLLFGSRDSHTKVGPPGDLLEKIAAMLTPRQSERLFQLRWQQAMPWICYEPVVVEKVGITPKEVERIRAGQDRATRTYQNAYRALRGSHSGALSKEQLARLDIARAKMKKESQQVLDSVLTSAQRAKLKKILGAPFDFDKMRYDVPPYQSVKGVPSSGPANGGSVDVR